MSNSSDWGRDEIKAPHRPVRGREREMQSQQRLCTVGLPEKLWRQRARSIFDFVYLFAYGANKTLLLATPAFLVHPLIEPCYTPIITSITTFWTPETVAARCLMLHQLNTVCIWSNKLQYWKWPVDVTLTPWPDNGQNTYVKCYSMLNHL